DKRHRRRDSAPPKVGHGQDLAYLEALAKFNDWRAQQRNSDILAEPKTTPTSQANATLPTRITRSAHCTIKEEASGNDDDDDDDDSDCDGDFSSDIELARDERMILNRSASRFEVPKSPRYARHHHRSSVAAAAAPPPGTPCSLLPDAAPKKPKRSVEFYRNINRIPTTDTSSNASQRSNNGPWNNGSKPIEKNHSNPCDTARFSLPAVLVSEPAGRSRTKRTKATTPKPNNTIYENEVAEFEAHHINSTFGDSYVVQSPPRLFYKANSSPYSDGTPKKQSNLKARPRVFKDKPAPAPPVAANIATTAASVRLSNCLPKQRHHSDSDSPLTGSYRKYELNSSSVYDEHVISSRAYRGSMKPTGAEEPVAPPPAKQRHKSLAYQTIVNKHGDLVDYALPFSDNADTTAETKPDRSSGTKQLTPGQDTLAEIRSCEQLINENFQFLQTTAFHDDSTSIITEPISVLKGRSRRIITDLDRSNASTLKEGDGDDDDDERLERERLEMERVDEMLETRQQEIDAQLAHLAGLQDDPQDILLELDSLQKWSKSIQMSDDFLQSRYTERNLLECFRRSIGSNLLTCFPNEVRYRVGSLRSAYACPLEFSCGLFRGVAVTLRKYSLNMERSLYFAEEACRRDFEVLSQVRHPTMATLMAVSYDAALNQATLLLEPFDFTLFDYIHKMNKRLSLIHATTVVQQISSAVCYLQECGYVHSNISSGCILMRRYPYSVKLTSFELTTDASTDEVRREIENRYGSTSSSRNSMTSSQNEELKKITTYARLIKNDEQFLRDKYRKLSVEVCETRSKPHGAQHSFGEGAGYDCRASRFLPYCKEYREKFSLFYYVAPELLIPKASFVYPSKSTDVYAIALLLWEILNGYVPFVVYNRAELEKLHTSADLPLPMFEKERCERFRQIFEGGLGDLNSRKITMGNVADLLDCLLLELGMEKNGTYDWLAEDYEEHANSSEVQLKNELNDVRKQSAHIEKADKIYFHTEESEQTKTPKQLPKKPVRKIKKTKVSPPVLQQLAPVQGQSVVGAKERPPIVDKKSPLGSTFSLSNSAIYQTIFDFNNKFLSPKSSSKQQVIYDRTSTVKKHKKPARANKKAAKELFEVQEQLNKSFIEPNSDQDRVENERDSEDVKLIDSIPLQRESAITKSLEQIDSDTPQINVEPVRPSCSDSETKGTPLQRDHPSKSCDSSPGARRRSITPKLNNSFRFTIGDFTLPDTPIARKNKIRKHAWLSDQKLRMAEESQPVTPEDCRSKSYFNAELAARSGSFLTSTNLNCSTSLQDIKPKRINISVNIIRSPEPRPTTVTVRQTGMPKLLVEGGIPYEDTLWRKEKLICERSQLPEERKEAEHLSEEQKQDGKTDGSLDDSLSVVTAHLSSVRDVIKKIETTFEKTGFDYSPARKVEGGSGKKPSRDGCSRMGGEGSLVVEENLLVPTRVLELEKTLEAEDVSMLKENVNGEAIEAEPAKPEENSSFPIPAPPPSPPASASPLLSHLNVLLANNHRSKPKDTTNAPVSPAEVQQAPEILSIPAPSPPIAVTFAPNSQLYLRRKALNAAGGNSVAIHHHQQTVYRESVVSSTERLPGTFVEPSLASTTTTTTTATTASTAMPPGSARKKKLTTRVTVNMRKISRRASDISPASSRPNSANLDDLDLPSSGCITPTGNGQGCATVRHSCGNELLRAFSKLRLIAAEEPAVKSATATTNGDPNGRSGTPVFVGSTHPGSRIERLVCCNCGNSMVPAEGLNVPAGSRIGMTAAFGEMNFPRESFVSMFEPPMTPTPGNAMAGRFHSITPFQKSTEDLYIDDDFCQGLNHMAANMELVEPLDEGQYLDTYGYDIYATEIYHAEEEEEEEEELMDDHAAEVAEHFTFPSHVAASAECTDDEAKFLEKCSQLNSQTLTAEFTTIASPIDCEPMHHAADLETMIAHQQTTMQTEQ
uniref:Protein kinase domain-containing protein n=1 Tax=Anopheles christyi TaxID=43041 RepID=A0A182K735_9DIPT